MEYHVHDADEWDARGGNPGTADDPPWVTHFMDGQIRMFQTIRWKIKQDLEGQVTTLKDELRLLRAVVKSLRNSERPV